jgi:nicotinamide mononucleotide (NMN) deamidase PncC
LVSDDSMQRKPEDEGGLLSTECAQEMQKGSGQFSVANCAFALQRWWRSKPG